MRGVFLNISKAFDKVWHDRQLYKLKRSDINGDLLKLIESFLLDRYHRCVFNWQTCKWNKITAGVPQGFILGPLCFLIYIYDLPSELCCSPKLFADNTSLFLVVKNINETAKKLNKDLKQMGTSVEDAFQSWPKIKMAEKFLFNLRLHSFKIFCKSLVIVINVLSFKGRNHAHLQKILIKHNRNWNPFIIFTN